jgi:hypothetical protein
VKVVAEAGLSVNYANGEFSSVTFHTYPDGAACFPTQDGGWIYASNSEDDIGGVGAIKFDSQGRAVNYKTILNGTSTNCSGKLRLPHFIIIVLFLHDTNKSIL